jgi:hypothetical protein
MMMIIIAMLMGAKWYLIVVLVDIFLVITNVEHPLMCLLGRLYTFFGDIAIQPSCALFN